MTSDCEAHQTHGPSPAGPYTVEPVDITVLHVDDDPEIGEVVARFLERADDRFSVVRATRAEDGIGTLESEPVDCIVSDYDLPRQNGLEFLQSVREDDPDIPFILFTGEGDEDVASDAISAGVTDYMRKGVGADQYAQLASRIENAVATYRVERAVRTLEQSGGGIAVLDTDGQLTLHNRVFADMIGYDVGDLQGLELADLGADYPSDGRASMADGIRQAFAGTSQQFEWRCERPDGSHLWADVTLRPATIGGERRVVACLQDVTAYKEREGELRFFEELAESVGVGIGVYDKNGRIEYANDAFTSILGADRETLHGTPVWEINPELTRAGFERYWASFDDAETRTTETTLSYGDTSVPVLVISTCGDLDGTVYHFGIVQDISDRRAYERRIAELHDATREMVQANTIETVCETAIRAVKNTLEFSNAGIWLIDESADTLEPVATTGGFAASFGDDPGSAGVDSDLWETYASGEASAVKGTADAPEGADPSASDYGELVLPLGEHGVLALRAASPRAFTDNDAALMKLLAANTQVALERTDRESTLERQSDRMEFFNSILRHDVLNGITVIKSRAEFLLEDLEGEQRRDAETIVEWSNDVTDIVQRVRIVLESLVGEGEPDLEPADLGETLEAELDRLEATYPEVTYERDTLEDVTVLANDLLGDVLGNVLSNAIDHNETSDLRLSVGVEERDEQAIVRIADNGTGVEDARKASIFRRDETGHTKSEGSGFGLFFVDTMVDQYGGDIRVEDNDAGGATFVIRLRTTDHETPTNP